MKRLFFLVIALAIFFCLVPSCNKNPDNPTPPIVDSATIMGFKDSTLLIKSITDLSFDSTGNKIDLGNVSYLYYDTVNRKVFFTAQPVTAAPTTNYIFSLSYNTKGLISRFTNSPLTDSGETLYTDYNYDAQNVLESQVTTYKGGNTETDYTNKVSLSSGGYSFSEKTSETDFVNDSILNIQIFDVNGRLVSTGQVGFPPYNNDKTTDSIFYDANGNVSKVIETNIENSKVTSTYNLFEFNSRDTKGDQFYNFNKILFNGISDLPGNADISFGSPFGGYNNGYIYQFTKFPSLSTTVYESFNSSYITFNPNPQYDSKNRLTRFRMYNGDEPYFYEDLVLTYYK